MAHPQVYKLTRYRSQLEISFVKELETRDLKWFYEPERLGTHRYLLDFYVPACKSWVECKGKFSTRDHDALLELGVTLWRERRHRLFMYTATQAYKITDGGFAPITHPQFWVDLLAVPPSDGPPKLIVMPRT